MIQGVSRGFSGYQKVCGDIKLLDMYDCGLLNDLCSNKLSFKSISFPSLSKSVLNQHF